MLQDSFCYAERALTHQNKPTGAKIMIASNYRKPPSANWGILFFFKNQIV